MLLFESSEPFLRVSWSVISVTAVTVAGFIAFAVTKALRAHHQRPFSGREGLIGKKGLADSGIAPEGKVFVNGEYWDAWSEETITAGEKVVVEAVEGMLLKVKRHQQR
jgi:membrane-bound serine protease (ClpP class)